MIPELPSQTAEVVCLIRAAERRRPAAERIVDDPWAHWFLGPAAQGALLGLKASRSLGRFIERFGPGIMTFVAARHRYIDDRLQEALDHDFEQVVLLGAGYDSRAYRFADALRGRPVFEVDFPATSRRKKEILDRHTTGLPPVDVRRVEIDFQNESIEDRLAAAGFRTGTRTFFAWEGVSMYLTRAAVKVTLSALRALGASGSGLAMDYWFYVDQPDLRSTVYRLSANLLHLLGEPVTFGIHPEDVGVFLERAGLRLVDLADGEELCRRYVREDARRIPPGVYVVYAVTA